MTTCKKADGGQHNNQSYKGVIKVGGGGGGDVDNDGSGNDGNNISG